MDWKILQKLSTFFMVGLKADFIKCNIIAFSRLATCDI